MERIACYGDSLLRKYVFPSLREGSLQIKWTFLYKSQKNYILAFCTERLSEIEKSSDWKFLQEMYSVLKVFIMIMLGSALRAMAIPPSFAIIV